VVCAGVLLLAGCSGSGHSVDVDGPPLSGARARACADLLGALPDHVDDQARMSVRGTGYTAAWGDPPIELRCGVPKPAQFDRYAACQTVNGVDWFIPESQQTGRAVDITMTAVGRAEYVEVQIPHEYFPPAATMADLADAVKQSIRRVKPCR
jgi:hypothetical protein